MPTTPSALTNMPVERLTEAKLTGTYSLNPALAAA